MLVQIKQDPDWLGDVSYIDTTKVGPVDKEWSVHQPPPGVASSEWYAICAGTHIGVFTSMYAFPHVNPVQAKFDASQARRDHIY